nr:UDP-N-acetylmuramoyl-tripeptide--D-alanyl-D-alanine ligase [Pelagicoccus albus]
MAGLVNDSRKVQPGFLFAAIKTQARDGHDFLNTALEAGASGAIVNRFQTEVEIPQLLVSDVQKALRAAARGYRETWKAKVIGITGSCGKTTCKELLACLLSDSETLSTLGNLNNLLGVPMSILKPQGQTAEFAVLEAGISEPGEMELLEECIQPEIGIITSIGPAHLQDLGSVEGVAKEKGKLLKGSRLEIAFVGSTCMPYLKQIDCSKAVVVEPDEELSKLWSYRFETSDGRTRHWQNIEGTVREFEYGGTGAGLASNAALAIAAASHLGRGWETVAESLRDWRPAQMRNEWRKLGDWKVFVDCYNANPLSMRDSLDTFVRETSGEEARFYLIGCMEELGGESKRLHEELGRAIPFRKQDFLLVIGGEASSVLHGMKCAGRATDNCIAIETAEEATEQLRNFSGNVFLKGSRKYRLESVLPVLQGGAAC